jgi:hypothetical protein
MFLKRDKEHIRELSKIRSKRYYQRHKEELKESKKYGSLYAYRKHKEELAKSLMEAQKQETKKQDVYSL